MHDTALGVTTQSKLTVQAPGFGERGSRQLRHPTTKDGLVSPEPWMAGGDLVRLPAVYIRWPRMAECPCSQGPRMARRDLVPCPVSGVGCLNGSLLICLRKYVVLCHTASRAWVGRRRKGRRSVWGGRHIPCAPSVRWEGTFFIFSVFGDGSLEAREPSLCFPLVFARTLPESGFFYHGIDVRRWGVSEPEILGYLLSPSAHTVAHHFNC